MTTITREQARQRHVAILAEAARVVARYHRLPRHTVILWSFACRIDDHFSCLTVACRCGCHA